MESLTFPPIGNKARRFSKGKKKTNGKKSNGINFQCEFQNRDFTHTHACTRTRTCTHAHTQPSVLGAGSTKKFHLYLVGFESRPQASSVLSGMNMVPQPEKI